MIISELMYHAPGTDVEGEFIEFTNRGTEVVDLTGWRVAGGVAYSFPHGVMLAPGEQLVIAANPSTAIRRSA